MMPIDTAIRHILINSLGVDRDRVLNISDSDLFLDEFPEIDSLALTNFLTALEDHFGITIDRDDLGPEVFETFGQFCTFVAQQRAR
jgi:acyl carrier protein